MRPAPAVVPTPPLAVHQLANGSLGPNIVGHDAAVGRAALLPRLQIIEHPSFVLVVAGVEIGIGDQAGDTQIERHIAAGHALIDQVEDLGEYFVICPIDLEERVGTVGTRNILKGCQIVSQDGPVVIPIDLSSDKARAFAAVERRADHFALSIPIGRQRVGTGVHGGVAQGAGAVDEMCGIGQRQIVDVGIAFGVVEPVKASDKLALDRAVVGVLPGDGVPLFAGDLIDVLAAAQQVKQGEG